MFSKMFTSPPPTPAVVLAQKLIQENTNMRTSLEPALDAIANDLYQQAAGTPLLEWKRAYCNDVHLSSGPFSSSASANTEIYLEMDVTKRVLDVIDATLHLGTKSIRVLEDARNILKKALFKYFDPASQFRFALAE